MISTRAPTTLSALLSAALAACSHSAPATPAAPPAAVSEGNQGTELTPERAAEIEALYRARQQEARESYTPADVDFMTGMIGHHAQALVMAALAPTHDASPAIRTLTARITNAQRDEITLMEQWLRDRNQPVPEIAISVIELTIRGVEHDPMMPGMLTHDQLRELDAARGRNFDRLFLTFMIQHHEGAVTMVHELFATDGAGQDGAAFKLASDIQVDQKTEIARMQQMLEAMGPGNHPAEPSNALR